jgi:hypothetical protein
LTGYEKQLIDAALPELVTNIDKVCSIFSSLIAASSFALQGVTFQRAPAAKV